MFIVEKLIDLALTSNGTMLAKINQRANDFDIQRNDLTAELSKTKYLQSTPKSKDEYAKRLKAFVKCDLINPENRRKIIHGLVNSVWVFDGGFFVFYAMDKQDPITIAEFKGTLHGNNIEYVTLCGSRPLADSSNTLLNGWGGTI